MDQSTVEQQVDGRYIVLEQLGRGGMGAVYRVRDERSGKELALKRLHATKQQFAAELFEREFHTLSELAHPRIIEVYDYGVDTAGVYYTMELLGGRDLHAEGKLDWRNACALLRDVASSLAILHSRRLVHADISPRNVRCTTDGRAKLLDFGAMMPMGVAKRVVGTPPFIAPEMVQQQALDGRADLFSLGALAYFVLTGRHAYPARTVKQLRDIWKTPPRAPAELEPEVPAALSQLVIELLQLNRNARPRSAGLVMERLCALASLPFDEREDVAQAYLTMPTLVGRDEPLGAVRKGLISAMRGKGSVVVVRGAAGSGRSRFLDACVLDAKLLGAHVLRTDAGDAGAYGAARALCQQLFELAPDTARRSAQLNASVLVHVLGAELCGCEPAGERPERRKLLAALRDFMLAAARSLRLLIAVDDADRIDEASASLLVALAQKASRRTLSVIMSMDAEGPGSAALDLIAALPAPAAATLELAPLTEEQTELLLRSVFGDANHLVALARRVHAISRGGPRAIMLLAAHLLGAGVVRYEAGSFTLPEQLPEDALPPSLAGALERRMAALEPDALELARVLALTDPTELPTSSYVELTAHRDRARTYRAIDRLVRAQLLDVEGDRYRLSDATIRGVLHDGTSAEQRVALHARLSRAFEHGGSSGRRAFHLMESAQEDAAIRVLLAQFLKDPNEPRHPLEDSVPGMLDLLERAAAAAERLRLPAPLRMELRMKTLGASQFVGDLPRFERLAPSTLDQLERDSGLREYHQLDASLTGMPRLVEALTRVQQRYDATPEAERGLAPADAVRELSRLCAIHAGIAAIAQDPEIIERTPSLTPLAPLSPAIPAIQLFCDSSRALLQGRSLRACALLTTLLERLDTPDRAGLGELYHKSLRLGALYILGIAESGMGLPSASERVTELEREPGHRVNAQHVHATYHLMQGNTEEAAIAERRAELVMLQDGQQQRYPNTTTRTEMIAHWLAEDAAGMKDVIERVAKLGAVFPRWSALAHLGRSHYRRMQGDPAGALEALQPALDMAVPLRHPEWPSIAGAHLLALTALGRSAEAAELGSAHLALCLREDIHPGYRRMAHATITALIGAGRAQEAARLADSVIAATEQDGARGLLLGAFYELRARAAIALGDAAAFERFAGQCAAEYRPDRNPALAAKHERLLRHAEAHDVAARGVVPRFGSQPVPARRSMAPSAVLDRIASCRSGAERARCVLAILSELTGSEQTFLYGLRDGRATLLCAQPDADPPGDLDTVIDRFLVRELEAEQATAFGPTSQALTLSVLDDARSLLPPALETQTQGPTLLSEDGGRVLRPVVLATKREGQPVMAAVAALWFTHGTYRMPDAVLLDALASALLENDDVDPVTCLV